MNDRRGDVRLADGGHAVFRPALIAGNELRALDEAGEYGEAELPADEDVLALGDLAGGDAVVGHGDAVPSFGLAVGDSGVHWGAIG